MRAETGQKRSSSRTRGKDDENVQKLTHLPKPSPNKIPSRKNATVLNDLTNKREVKEMGKRGNCTEKMIKSTSTRSTRSNSKPAVDLETCKVPKKKPLAKIPSSPIENVTEEVKTAKASKQTRKQVKETAAAVQISSGGESGSEAELASIHKSFDEESEVSLPVKVYPAKGRHSRSSNSSSLAQSVEFSSPDKSPRPVRQTRKLAKAQTSETPSKRIKMTAQVSDSETDFKPAKKQPTRTTRYKALPLTKTNPSSPLPERKSSRLQSKSSTPARNAKSPTPERKKLTIYRTEPKPELLLSLADDIYEFDYDSSERKPVKKRRPRKPRSKTTGQDSAVFQVKNTKTPPKRAKQAPRAARKAKVAVTLSPPTLKAVEIGSTTPLLKSVAAKLAPLSHDLSSESSGQPVDVSYEPIHFDDQNDKSMESGLLENQNKSMESGLLENQNKSMESGLLAGDLEQLEESANVSNCFGFEEQENSPPKQMMVKSTPLKQKSLVASSLPSVSPVRKIPKVASRSRPARLDRQVVTEMIRGIRPLPPVKENVDQVAVPPTPPPPVFHQPPRRSYSKEMRTVKRAILKPDNFDSEEEEEEVAPKKKRTVKKKSKRDAEAEEWVKMMKSHFEDVEKFDLSS